MGKRPKIRPSKARLRSAISRGRRMLDDVDHRWAEMRRLKDLISQHVADLGGREAVTHSEALLISRASMIAVLTEMQEREFVKADLKIKHPAEYDRYLRSVGMLTRVLSTLGLQRRSRNITPTVDEYLRQQREEEAKVTEDVEDEQDAEVEQ